MKVSTYVWCTTSFVGFHRWKDAPDHLDYLRPFHRHIFHVKACKEVTDLNREIEFHELKESIDKYIEAAYLKKRFEYSCEQIAADLVQTFKLKYCEVNEDTECGATVVVEE